MTERRRTGGRRPMKAERATTETTCGSCQTTIQVGQAVARDQTGRAHHADCKRRGVVPVVAPPLARFSSPIPRATERATCPGCGYAVDSEDAVAVFSTSWHADCRCREARLG